MNFFGIVESYMSISKLYALIKDTAVILSMSTKLGTIESGFQ